MARPLYIRYGKSDMGYSELDYQERNEVMECRFRKAIEKGDGECGLTYPDCQKFVLCAYAEKYWDLVADAKIVEAEQRKGIIMVNGHEILDV